ncbi:MAG: hypothetical protein RID42_06440 [Alphaproteobacteria bacterium]
MTTDITVSSTVDVTWLAEQTKGSATIEIEFGGVAQSAPVHIGFAVQQLAQARAAARVIASFFLLLARETAVSASDQAYEVSLGDNGSAVTLEVRPDVRPVTAFPLTVAVSEDCNTRAAAADEAAATLIDAIDRYLTEHGPATDEALVRLQPAKSYYPEVLHLAIQRLGTL